MQSIFMSIINVNQVKMVHVFDFFMMFVCIIKIFSCLLSTSPSSHTIIMNSATVLGGESAGPEKQPYIIFGNSTDPNVSHKPTGLFKTLLVSSYPITNSLSVPGPIFHSCCCSVDDLREESGRLSLLPQAEVAHIQNLALLHFFSSIAL